MSKWHKNAIFYAQNENQFRFFFKVKFFTYYTKGITNPQDYIGNHKWGAPDSIIQKFINYTCDAIEGDVNKVVFVFTPDKGVYSKGGTRSDQIIQNIFEEKGYKTMRIFSDDYGKQSTVNNIKERFDKINKSLAREGWSQKNNFNNNFSNKNIFVIIDDIYTSGSTSFGVIRYLDSLGCLNLNSNQQQNTLNLNVDNLRGVYFSRTKEDKISKFYSVDFPEIDDNFKK